ncbi:MAG: MBOAT family protein [Paraburkholderia tropica]|uniref:Probable alginate O-acetylase AlgI n=1 Tax=Paraburkholderia tropica TaxID=92647 RepID=A0ABX5MQ28_9BURK|nr:MBOAT family protein [Paraburkholderia tropica]MBB3000781.1 alginate O-acetyltransferase complex protein AlgI [Paraburkholderia tropica]MBB6319431.1 alginate O-acetyltransferase complex protein AlgI [Paraburkholderia tropica]PXX16204.1 alginate O-acetyltransferase complex protein AlgI [Paraburkholderia tropica]PZW82596.1 alginate O-acetyltransferase complex protein AlgI [Paraburkholderia tropica]
MVFSSAIFLYVFLPITLGLYYALTHRLKNIWLLIASLIFYAWGDPKHLPLMVGSILFNWIVGLLIAGTRRKRLQLLILSAGVSVNLLFLIYYKYAAFLTGNANEIASVFGRHVQVLDVALPVGISFFTFHSISYIVDVYRGEAKALRSPLDMGVYISLFPQLIAGPIIRFHDIADQILHRRNTLERFSSGIERFVFGLGKKVLIANTLGQVADQVFALPQHEISTATAWFGIVCYTLQIYFDFSGYSDMAIGLARMFGFELTENFNYPYIATSIREFWRRWHISLSTWFRDYLYIPLGGNRASPFRVCLNLFTVFLLCGLWHGASWNFVVWGAFHGSLLVLERSRFGKTLDSLPKYVGWAYTLLMVMIGWVFFRAEDFAYACAYVGALFGFAHGSSIPPQIALYLNSQVLSTLVLGAILSTPVAISLCRDWMERRFPSHSNEPLPAFILAISGFTSNSAYLYVRLIMVFAVLTVCAAELASGTYNPFIYFRF